jgi:hypothetical protein
MHLLHQGYEYVNEKSPLPNPALVIGEKVRKMEVKKKK